MLPLLFAVCMIGIFGKLLLFGIKAAWGISKILITIILLPLILVGLVIGGLMSIAFFLLIVVGIFSLILPKL